MHNKMVFLRICIRRHKLNVFNKISIIIIYKQNLTREGYWHLIRSCVCLHFFCNNLLITMLTVLFGASFFCRKSDAVRTISPSLGNARPASPTATNSKSSSSLSLVVSNVDSSCSKTLVTVA